MIRSLTFLAYLFVFLVSSGDANNVDWLIQPGPFQAFAKQSADGRELELTNGLLRRVIRLQPNAATVALDNLISGESILRGGGHDVVMPPGQKPAFGNSPCLQSRWGQDYFRRLDLFHRESGFTYNPNSAIGFP